MQKLRLLALYFVLLLLVGCAGSGGNNDGDDVSTDTTEVTEEGEETMDDEEDHEEDTDEEMDGEDSEEEDVKEEGADEEVSAEAPTGPIQIGAIGPLTGDGAVYGDVLQKALDLRVKQINEAGGIGGRQVEVIWEDGKCAPSDASKAAQKLIGVDGVSAIFGGFCSGETLAAAPVTEKKKVILFSAGSSSPEVTHAGDFVFRTAPSDSSQGKVLADYANGQGYAKIGALVEQTDYAVAIAATFENHFEGDIVKETYLPTESDFKTRVTKLKNAGIEALFIDAQTSPKVEIILKQLQEQDFVVPFLFNEVVTSDSAFATEHQAILEKGQSVGGNFVAPDNPQLEAFLEVYQTAYETEPNFTNYIATVHDGIDILLGAIEAVGDERDTEAIRDHLYGVKDYQGLYKGLTIDENGDVNITHSLFKFDGEGFVLYEETE